MAYSFAFARAVEEALAARSADARQVLRGVMAELERIANHFGDIGAICNDASFALIHAHCGILRERVLAACGRAFGHRLMMDRIVPGGVEDAAPGAARAILAMLDEIEQPFAEIVRVYDDTPSLAGPHLPAPASSGQRWCRAGPPAATSAAAPAAPSMRGAIWPMRRMSARVFEVPVLTAGDVDARVWIRIREVEQSIKLLRGWLADMPSGPVRVPLPELDKPSEGVAIVEAFRGDVMVWVRFAGGRIARCSRARCVVVPVAAAGGRDREQHRRGLPALQQVVQLLVLGARPLMRTLLLKSLFATAGDDRRAAAGAADARGCVALRSRPALETRVQRLYGRSITIREVDAGSCNGCELEIHALNNAVYDVERFGIRFVASPRHADVLLVTGPMTHNMKVALERTYAATPDPKWVVAVGDCAAGCGVFGGELRHDRLGRRGGPGGPDDQGLPAAADRSVEGADRADGYGGGEGEFKGLEFDAHSRRGVGGALPPPLWGRVGEGGSGWLETHSQPPPTRPLRGPTSPQGGR